MLYFGSRNFGQANFGKGLITTAVDESLSTSTMMVAGYKFFNTSTFHSHGVVNADIASGLVQGGFLDLSGTGTTIVSGIKMTWRPTMATMSALSTVQNSGFIAWDSQLVGDKTWTTQNVD
jgi:hypothetical protein